MSHDFNILPASASDAAELFAPQDSPYDTVWAQSEVPTQQPEGIERVMLAEDKLFVVLAVVLIIWIGIAAMILRTDRKLTRLERTLAEPADELDPLR